MMHDVFISYSSHDKPAADAACAVLESKGIRCWIAPRDILPGADWGQSIIDGINGCKLMVLIFSNHANQSQQVKREVERVVNRGRPIIPVRVEEVLPAQSLEYFLSTPHWLDAFTPPLERHLEHLAATVKQVLSQPSEKPMSPPPRPRNSWRWYLKPLGTTAAVVLGLVLLAMIAFGDRLTKKNQLTGINPNPEIGAGTPPTASAPPSKSPEADKDAAMQTPAPAAPSTLLGRWQTEMTGEDGTKYNCLMDIKEDAQLAAMLKQMPAFYAQNSQAYFDVAFSDECPAPFCGARGKVQFAQDGVYAPTAFRAGQDTGTYSFSVEGLDNFSGPYKLEPDKALVLSYGQGAQMRWQRVPAEGPLPDGAAAVLPEKTDWPMKDVPGFIQRAQNYVRAHWQKDAMMVNLELSSEKVLGNLGAPKVTAHCQFYSSNTKHGLWFDPRPSYGRPLRDSGPSDPYRGIPTKLLDLPEAIDTLRQRGVKAKDVSKATLQYDYVYDYRKVRENNAILPPCPYKENGFHWRIESDREMFYVQAEKP
jgi:hypothetical protein